MQRYFTSTSGNCSSCVLDPNGHIALLITDACSPLPESGSILHSLAEDCTLLPAISPAYAQILPWVLFEQYSYEPVITTHHRLRIPSEASEAHTPHAADNQLKSCTALGVIAQHVERLEVLVAIYPIPIADITPFTYAHVMRARGYDVAARAQIDPMHTAQHFIVSLAP